MDGEEKGHTLYWVEVVAGIAGVAYYVLLILAASGEDGSGRVVPIKNRLLHNAGNWAESLASWAWDKALAARMAYWREVNQ